MMARTVGKPTQISRRWWVAANRIARAATSGSKIGGTGCGRSGILFNPQSNWGVFIAARYTIVRCTFSLSWKISDRRASVKPRTAYLAPQYTDCSGTAR